jgi:hypothetical protein
LELKPPLPKFKPQQTKQNLRKKSESSREILIDPHSKMIDINMQKINQNQVFSRRRNTNFNVPMSEINAQIKASKRKRSKPKKPINFMEQNLKDLEKMKRFTRNKEYIMKVEDDSDLNKILAMGGDIFTQFLSSFPDKYQIKSEVFDGMDQDEAQIEMTSSMLTNSFTQLKREGGLKVLDNHKFYALQMEVDDFENRKNLYQNALTVYKNLLDLMYVPKNVYKYLATKLELSGATVIKRGHNNIKDRLENRNAVYAGNSVTMYLGKGELDVPELKGFLVDNPEFMAQLEAKRKEPLYLEEIKEANGEIVRLEGLNAIRFEITKQMGIRNMKYLDFGNSRIGFTNIDTLDIILKRYEYCVKYNGNTTMMKDFELSAYGFDKVPVTIGKFNHTNEMIFKLTLNLEADNPTQKQINLFNQMSLLLLGKYYLSDFGFIGYTNSSQEVHYAFDINGKAPNAVLTANVVRVLRSYSSNMNELTQEISDNCEKFTNTLVSKDFLGERVPEYDIEQKDYGFVAFLKEGVYRFVFRSPRVTLLNDHNVIQLWAKETNNKGGELSCAYHSDDYYTGINLGEMFLISFFVDESKIKKLPHVKAKEAQKKKHVEERKAPVKKNVIQQGQDLNSLFKVLI